MLGIDIIIGGLMIALAIVFVVRFAHGTITTVFAVAVVFIGLFLVVGTPGLEEAGQEMRGLIPGTGGAVYTGESLAITSMGVDDGVLLISINNRGAEELAGFEVFINGEAIDAEANVNKLLPRTDGVLVAEYAVEEGDVVLVVSGTARAEKVFEEEDVFLAVGPRL